MFDHALHGAGSDAADWLIRFVETYNKRLVSIGTLIEIFFNRIFCRVREEHYADFAAFSPDGKLASGEVHVSVECAEFRKTQTGGEEKLEDCPITKAAERIAPRR